MRHLTIHEAAEALQLSVPTIKRYIYDDKLKSIKLPGGQHRIPESEIERLLALGGETSDAIHKAPDTSTSTEQRVAVLERWVTEMAADIERLTAALEVVSHYCSRSRQEPDGLSIASPDPAHSQLAVLGPGCRRCNALLGLVAKVLEATGRGDVTVERISDLDAISAYGPVLTPALVINGTIVLGGRVPSEKQLCDLLQQHLG
jgi:excisionase family DNA binding protein